MRIEKRVKFLKVMRTQTKTEARQRQPMKQCDLELTFSLDNYYVRIKCSVLIR